MATSGYLSRICWDGKFNVATHRSDSTAEPGVWEGIVRGEAFLRARVPVFAWLLSGQRTLS